MYKKNIYLNINSKRQFLSIQGDQKDLPILLYLHGGPGDAALPLINKYNSSLSEKYNLIVWEQRGAGKSYYKFKEREDVTIDLFLSDLHCIIKYLLDKYDKEKLYLLGHSWGSVLGLKFVQRYPELVYKYIGCGQVVNMSEASKLQYEYVKLRNKNNPKVLKRIENIDLTYSKEDWIEDLLFIVKRVVKSGGSLYGRSNYNQLVKDFLFSKEYSIKDLINREKGSLQSIKYLWQELMEINFINITEYEVPIIFLEGRHDFHVSSLLVKEYFESIKSPKEIYWFEKSGHFPQWEEANRFNEIVIEIVDDW